jgi:hypothetical protein
MPTEPEDKKPKQPPQPKAKSDDTHTVKDLLEELDAVDADTDEAKLNKTSISDNRGGRIELDEKQRSTRVNMMDWIPEEALGQWKKDHPSEQDKAT